MRVGADQLLTRLSDMRKAGSRLIGLIHSSEQQVDANSLLSSQIQAATGWVRVGACAAVVVVGSIGYTRFNAPPLIKLRKAPRQQAQRILSEFDTLKGTL